MHTAYLELTLEKIVYYSARLTKELKARGIITG